MDLAEGHVAAVKTLLAGDEQLLSLNLGSGREHSVLEVVDLFEQVSGRPIPYTIINRRKGDAAISVANPAKAERCLGWRAQRSLGDICRDGWAWQLANPNGCHELKPTYLRNQSIS